MEASDLPNRKRSMHSLQSEVSLDGTSLILRQGGLERIVHFQPNQVSVVVHANDKPYYINIQVPWHKVIDAETGSISTPAVVSGPGGSLWIRSSGPGEELEMQFDRSEGGAGVLVETKLTIQVPYDTFEPLAREWANACQTEKTAAARQAVRNAMSALTP